MAAWAGLGYYSRARNLIACTRAVAALPGGRFPEIADELARLPGIGAYTSAAIAAIRSATVSIRSAGGPASTAATSSARAP